MPLLRKVPWRTQPTSLRQPATDIPGLRSVLVSTSFGIYDAVSNVVDDTFYGPLANRLITQDYVGRATIGYGLPANTGCRVWSGRGIDISPITYTRIMVFKTDITGGVFGGLFCATYAGTLPVWSFQDAGNQETANIWLDGLNSAPLTTWANLDNGNYRALVFRCNNSTLLEWWLDGIKQTNITMPGTPTPPETFGKAVFGGSGSGGTLYTWPCSIAVVAVSDQVLCDEQCRLLSADWLKLFALRNTTQPIGAVAVDPVLSNLVATSITSTGSIPRVDYSA